jgi:hypothetical protein
MPAAPITALAIHVCADIASAGPDRRWPPVHAAQDTAQRVARICSELGIADQRTLAGEQATVASLLGALAAAGATLADDGLLVLTFSGHTVRGDGPIETACWCLFDGGIELSQVAGQLAPLPRDASVIVICDSCYASAIASVLIGTQEVVVLASCGADQTMVDRLRSEFVVRLEEFVASQRARCSLAQLRAVLEDDTPDCERPVVWTNAASRWALVKDSWPAPPSATNPSPPPWGKGDDPPDEQWALILELVAAAPEDDRNHARLRVRGRSPCALTSADPARTGDGG